MTALAVVGSGFSAHAETVNKINKYASSQKSVTVALAFSQQSRIAPLFSDPVSSTQTSATQVGIWAKPLVNFPAVALQNQISRVSTVAVLPHTVLPVPGQVLTSAAALKGDSIALPRVISQYNGTTPSTTTPGTVAPGETNPGTTTPGGTTPSTTTPGTVTPQETTPNGTTPGTTIPSQTQPNLITPRNPPGQTPPSNNPSDISPASNTRGGSSYVGIAGNIGFSGGETALGVGSFTLISKVGLLRNISIRPTAVIGDNNVVLIPVTYDFSLRRENVLSKAFGISPYIGGGLAINTGTNSDTGPLITAGVDVPLTPQLTATAGLNVGFINNTSIGLLIGVGYNFSGFGL
jgi:hypothetical protein